MVVFEGCSLAGVQTAKPTAIHSCRLSLLQSLGLSLVGECERASLQPFGCFIAPAVLHDAQSPITYWGTVKKH